MGYKAVCGFELLDAETEWGWPIRTASDIMLALQGYSCFETVAEDFLWQALGEAVEKRKIYANVKDLACTIAANYI